MLLGKYFSRKCSLLFILMLFPVFAFSLTEKQCGEKFFRVKVTNGARMYKSQYLLYYKKSDEPWKLFYKSDTGVYFHVACIQNKSKNYLLIFQEYCSGNGCPELTYGVFDPHTERLLIKPTDWLQGNYSQTKKIIGYPPPFLSDYKDSFCCQN